MKWINRDKLQTEVLAGTFLNMDRPVPSRLRPI